MKETDFYRLVGESDFCERYYVLCEHFVLKSHPARPLRSEIEMICKRLGRTPTWRAEDNSYNFDRKLSSGNLYSGFWIQFEATVEFAFCLYSNQSRLGSNYAVIAYHAAQAVGKPVANPPYPRPAFRHLEDLASILTELFALSDTLTTIVESGAEHK